MGLPRLMMMLFSNHVYEAKPGSLWDPRVINKEKHVQLKTQHLFLFLFLILDFLLDEGIYDSYYYFFNKLFKLFTFSVSL